MAQGIDLKEIERRARRVAMEDGLPDVMFGVWLVLFSFFVMNVHITAHIFWAAFMILGTEVIRRRVTYPRIGYARLQTEEKETFQILVTLAVGIPLVFGAVVVAREVLGEGIGGHWWETFVFSVWLFLTPVLGWVAYLYDAKRWYGYAALFALGGLGLMVDKPGVLALAGGVMALVGSRVFIRFLRENPVLDGGEEHGE